MMQSRQGGLLSGPEPIFGVCEALGRDFRINPMLIRFAFGVGLIVNLGVTLAIYAGLAVLVLASRLLFPDVHAEVPETASAGAVTLAAERRGEVPARAEQPELAEAA
ncbi:PspC domain-containing protein [Sphingomonas ginkgonis]|uniref:PspC domain-containing protein n=1 Tax=Sphingomonas ginkgonis TaxID=2315330 RepID=UPI00163A0B1A|nr:PspC domain-containing protein [Sphingomonas ginkgonis]